MVCKLFRTKNCYNVLDMNPSLLATKFHIPPMRSDGITRPRLLERMTAGLRGNRKLTLVSAPAGYGKTTVVAEWLHFLRNGQRVVWLSLDEADNEPVRFLLYFIVALRSGDESLGQSAQSLLSVPQISSPTIILDELLNELAALETQICLVMDDYHVITNPQIHQALEYFIDHQPAQTHLILTTRADPPLSLARLRASGQMTEIRARDLRFTPDEAHQFFDRSLDISLAENTLRALDERTEGWAVGLQLATLALQYQPDPVAFIETFRGSHRYVLDYLGEEVVRQQDDETRAFLVRTSILDRFSAELCEALTDRVDSQAIITRLEADNLFIIPLDDERCWYRYHHLFADYLRSLLSKSEQAAQYQKASAWHETNDLTAEAVRYALASGASNFAADVIVRALKKDTTWSGFDLGLLISWLDALPKQILRSRPQLSLDAALIFYTAGRLELSEAHIAQTEQILKSSPAVPENNELLALATLYRGLIASVRGELEQAIEQIAFARSRIQLENHVAHTSALFSLGQAYHGLGETVRAIECYLQSSDEAKAAGMLFPMVNSRCAAAHIQIAQGRLSLAEQTCLQAIEYAGGVRLPQLGLAWTILGGIALERNDLASAEHLLQDGLTLSRQANLNDDVTWGLIFLARLHTVRDDAAGALAAIQEALNIVRAYGVPHLSLQVSSYLARIQHQIGQKHAAAQWAVAYQSARNDITIEHADLTLVRILLSTGELDAIPGILNPILEKATAAGLMQTCIEVMILLGLYHRAKGETAAALDWLGKSLKLAAPEGYTRLFLDEGQPIQELLPRARPAAPELVDSLLGRAPAEADSRSAPLDRLPDPLSEQEIRVLKLVVAGKSNAEIATELFISVGTAKWHIHNILQKLGAKNRPQAIARVRELGI